MSCFTLAIFGRAALRWTLIVRHPERLRRCSPAGFDWAPVAVIALAGDGNLTGVSLYDAEIYGKRLQILKEAVPSASKVAFLNMRRTQGGVYGAFDSAYQAASQRLQVSLIPMLLQKSTSSEYQRVFAEIARQRFDGILVSDIPDLRDNSEHGALLCCAFVQYSDLAPLHQVTSYIYIDIKLPLC